MDWIKQINKINWKYIYLGTYLLKKFLRWLQKFKTKHFTSLRSKSLEYAKVQSGAAAGSGNPVNPWTVYGTRTLTRLCKWHFVSDCTNRHMCTGTAWQKEYCIHYWRRISLKGCLVLLFTSSSWTNSQSKNQGTSTISVKGSPHPSTARHLEIVSPPNSRTVHLSFFNS